MATASNHAACITGIGSYSPGAPVTNAQLEDILQAPVNLLMSYFGVESRHYVVDPVTGKRIEQGLGTTEMAARAGESALRHAGVEPAEIDVLITVSSTPDSQLPPLSFQVQKRLGLKRIQMLDIRGGCAASVQGMMVGDALIRSGAARRVLICGAECVSPAYYCALLRSSDRRPEALMNGLVMADGAGAVLLEAREGAEARTTERLGLGYLNTCSRFTDRALGFTLSQDLTESKHDHKAVRETLPEVVQAAAADLVAGAGGGLSDLDVFIIPQVNKSMVGMVAKDMPMEKVFYIGNETGNAPAAGIFRALDKAVERGRVQMGRSKVAIMAIETCSWLYAVTSLH